MGLRTDPSVAAFQQNQREAAAAAGIDTGGHVVLAATGSVQGDAAQIPSNASVVFVTSDSAAKGVKLPAAFAGANIIIFCDLVTVAKLWPATGDAIGVAAANASINLTVNKGVRLIAKDATTWYILGN